MQVARVVDPPVAPRRSPSAAPQHRLPPAWKRYIVRQRHGDYSRAAHATWGRLRDRTAELVHDLNPWLHPSYMEGFERLILPWSRIPTVGEVSEALAEFGWRAVCVDGYLPTKVYAGLLARRVFPVARHIRRAEHLDFSPAPDLAHDLVGHIPMLVCVEHGQFLRRLAAAMASAVPSLLDHQMYLAQRACAALRSNRVPQRLEAAEARVARAHRNLVHHPSALTELGRLYLWCIEFGLLGTPTEFRIYGAGLLSSPAETRAVCRRHAPVRELSLAASHRDIHFSELQSSYFVAPDYAHLHRVLTSVQRRWSSSSAPGRLVLPRTKGLRAGQH
jgi:phenylalanine-4-hydroxylase